MFIRKAHAGSAPGHTWEKDGQVIEVPDELAFQLLNIPHGGFSVSDTPEPETVEEFDKQFEQGEEVELQADEPEEATTETRKSPGRPRLPRDANGNIIRN